MIIKKFWNRCVLKPSCCSVAESCPTLCDLWTIACQASLSMRFPWEEYWRHFLLQGIFPDQRSTRISCIGRWILYHWATREALVLVYVVFVTQLLSHVQSFATSWAAACQASLSFTSSNSCPLSWWRHPTISSSVAPFSSCPQSLPVSSSFPMSWLFVSGYFFF